MFKMCKSKSVQKKTKMRIKNKTKWDTRDLQKLFTECCRRDGMDKKLVVFVETTRGRIWRRIHGSTQYYGSYVNMWLPRIWKTEVKSNGTRTKTILTEMVQVDIDWTARVFMHELAHIRGLRHEEMLDMNEYNMGWTKDFMIRVRGEKPRLKVDLVKKRYDNVLKHISDKQRKIKRLQTALKKWQQKRKYYEKKVGSHNEG